MENTELSPLLSASVVRETLAWRRQRSAQRWRWGTAVVLCTCLGVSSVFLAFASYKNIVQKASVKTNAEQMRDDINQIFQAGFSLFTLGGVKPSGENIKKYLNETSQPNMFPWMTLGTLGEALNYGNEQLQKRIKVEQALQDRGITLDPDCAMAEHQRFMKLMPKGRRLVNYGIIKEGASQYLSKNMNLSSLEVLTVLPLLDITGVYLFGNGDSPEVEARCWSGRPYRMADGTCNNLKNPTWGATFSPFRRVMNPDYADGISAPRVAHSGKPLPNARNVSVTFFETVEGKESAASVLSMLFGLFVDHDLTSTAGARINSTLPVTCCDPQVKNNSELKHPDCYEIDVSPSDPFYSQFNVTCLEFLRSGHGNYKTFGPRQQMNQITSFLDGSGVYGSSDIEQHSLRAHKGGELLNSTVHNEEMMLQNKNGTCGNVSIGEFCFVAGDFRSNEQVQLTTVHGLWLREHNRIARMLAEVNPQWDDERLYQEARRVVVATLQHITYNEYLPLVLGAEQLEKNNLKLQSTGYYDGYTDTIEPTISNVFAVAAYRFGHGQVRDQVDLSENETLNGVIKVRDAFLNPKSLYEHGSCPHFNGMLKQNAKEISTFVTRELRDFTFKGTKRDYGTDLNSLTLQRSRDQGTAAYPVWRSHCGLSPIRTWNDLAKFTSAKDLGTLMQLYEDVSDLDLTVGAVLESKQPDALVGPTFGCLIGEQFDRLRRGDRYWYEAGNQPLPFTKEQLQEIRKVSLARLLCDNSPCMKMVQPQALRGITETNRPVSCSDLVKLSKMDFTFWKNSTDDIYSNGSEQDDDTGETDETVDKNEKEDEKL